MPPKDTQFFLDLERDVWRAQVDGDATADRKLLSPDFVGVYPTGFSTRDDHVGQLVDGPVVDSFTLTQARHIQVSDTAVLLSYRADFRRPGNSEPEAMFVSSLWMLTDSRWINSFSQDTVAS